MKKEREFYTVRGYQMLDINSGQLTPSIEDHLEMIYRLCIEEDFVRVNQLAGKLNIQPSSTTKVVKKLRDLGLVHYQEYGFIQLTKEGREIGSFLLTRHRIIEQFLKNIGIKKTLLKDTEMMEHFISHSTLNNIHFLNEFFSNNPEVLEQYEKFKNKFRNDVI